jgi:hypothetical protein
VNGTPNTHRLFLLGAGFSKPAGLPLASELLGLVLSAVDEHLSVGHDGERFNHLARAVDRYCAFLESTAPEQNFDLEQFGAWLDWEHTLRMQGSDTFSEHGSQAGLQLRWGIGKALHDRMPQSLPDLYVQFAERLTTSDVVLTLNHDLLLERALTEVGLPFRRFRSRYSEISDSHAEIDDNAPDEMLLLKLHGSIDWTHKEETAEAGSKGWRPSTSPLAEGPRPETDPLRDIAVIPADDLDRYYTERSSWYWHPTFLLPPSTAKPLARSPLVPLWEGIGQYAYMRGGFTIIGCSLPPGDPYVLQLVHQIATDYVAGRTTGGNLWPQRKMKLVDYRSSSDEQEALMNRYRFMDPDHLDVFFDGICEEVLDDVFESRS